MIDLHTEARGLSYYETTFRSLLKQLCRSDWAEGRDAAPFDVTFEAAEEREALGEGLSNAGTFYRSYVACMVSDTLRISVRLANSCPDTKDSPKGLYTYSIPLKPHKSYSILMFPDNGLVRLFGASTRTGVHAGTPDYNSNEPPRYHTESA
jgi:hypothetical protein